LWKEKAILTLVSLSKAALAELIPPPYMYIKESKMLSVNFYFLIKLQNNMSFAYPTYPRIILSEAIYVRDSEAPPITKTDR
jgi:hypothetical protein